VGEFDWLTVASIGQSAILIGIPPPVAEWFIVQAISIRSRVFDSPGGR
jgi:hypothetical protein